AMKRLSALSDYTELGAGFKIAMRDLEIRGAGNLLGDEQSGHVAALGFELYMAMLDEAVAEIEPELAGEEVAEPVRLDVEVDAYAAERLRAEIPEATYEPGRSQLTVRVPDDPAARFPAVLHAADALLAAVREPAGLAA